MAGISCEPTERLVYCTASRQDHAKGRSGETGRRAGLKIPFPSGSVGSIPTSGTSSLQHFSRAADEFVFDNSLSSDVARRLTARLRPQCLEIEGVDAFDAPASSLPLGGRSSIRIRSRGGFCDTHHWSGRRRAHHHALHVPHRHSPREPGVSRCTCTVGRRVLTALRSRSGSSCGHVEPPDP